MTPPPDWRPPTDPPSSPPLTAREQLATERHEAILAHLTQQQQTLSGMAGHLGQLVALEHQRVALAQADQERALKRDELAAREAEQERAARERWWGRVGEFAQGKAAVAFAGALSTPLALWLAKVLGLDLSSFTTPGQH